MRIALIVPGFSASEDDWCIPALLDLVRVLSREHEVVVFALRYPYRQGRYRIHSADVRAFGGGETAGIGRVLLLVRALRTILREHDESLFDVVHGVWADEPGILAVATARLRRIPSVVSLMGGELVAIPDIEYGGQLSRMNRLLTRVALWRASAVTVGSTYLRRLSQPYGSAKRLFDAPLGIDSAVFQSLETGSSGEIELSGCPALLSVGSLVLVKDHAMLLAVMASTVETVPDAHLHIVGDGPQRTRLIEFARELKLSGHITFHGEVSHDRLPAFYRSADLMLVTSRHEAQSMVALEAAAYRCPVLGTAVGILPDISSPSGSLASGDERAFTNSLLALIDDPHRLTALRYEGLERVGRSYTLDHTVPRLLDVYRSVLECGTDACKIESQNTSTNYSGG